MKRIVIILGIVVLLIANMAFAATKEQILKSYESKFLWCGNSYEQGRLTEDQYFSRIWTSCIENESAFSQDFTNSVVSLQFRKELRLYVDMLEIQRITPLECHRLLLKSITSERNRRK